MSDTSRKRWTTLLRVVVCIGALYWVLNNVTYYDYAVATDGVRYRAEFGDGEAPTVTLYAADGTGREVIRSEVVEEQRGLRTAVRTAKHEFLALGLLMFAPVTFIQSFRFRWMLRAQDIEVGYWESVKLCFAGNFLNFVTALGSTGGDVFKMYYVSLHTSRKTEAATTVLLDRAVGLIGLILVAGCVILVRSGDGKLTGVGYALLAIILGAIAGILLLFWPRARAVVAPLVGKLPFASHLQRIDAATRRLKDHKSLVMLAVLSTVLLQLIAVSSFVCVAYALHMRMDGGRLWDYYAYLSSGVVIAAVPISFQGLGTMEAFYKHVFLGTHGTLAALLCLAMATRAINLIWSLPGALVAMTGAYRPRTPREEPGLA